jgi:hypothetical protein
MLIVVTEQTNDASARAQHDVEVESCSAPYNIAQAKH